MRFGRAGLTITAGNAAKTYGQGSGLGDYTVDGLLNDDAAASVDLASTGSATTANVGDYVITADNADGTGLANYDITYVDGVLSVGRAGLTITAHDASKPWGQPAQLDGYAVEGLLNTDSVRHVTLRSDGGPVLSRLGEHAIVASDAEGSGLSNYDVTYVDGTLSVDYGAISGPEVVAQAARAAADSGGPGLAHEPSENTEATWEVIDGGILLPELCALDCLAGLGH